MADISRHNNSRGQLLIESMIAIGIMVVGLLGIMTLLTRSLSLNRVVSDQYVAMGLATEGIEVVKNIIDSNCIKSLPWNDGLPEGDYEVTFASESTESEAFDKRIVPASGRRLWLNTTTGQYNYAPVGNETRVVRTVGIALAPSGDEMTVTSKVDWTTRGGGSFTIDVEDHFFNWRPSCPLEEPEE